MRITNAPGNYNADYTPAIEITEKIICISDRMSVWTNLLSIRSLNVYIQLHRWRSENFPPQLPPSSWISKRSPNWYLENKHTSLVYINFSVSFVKFSAKALESSKTIKTFQESFNYFHSEIRQRLKVCLNFQCVSIRHANR